MPGTAIKMIDSMASQRSAVGRQSILDGDRVVWKFPEALTGAG